MTTQINKLQAYQGEHLQHFISHITSVTHPEKIFLLTASANQSLSESIFWDRPVHLPGPVHYYFLVLKQPGDPTHNEPLQDRIENRHGHSTALTAMVMAAELFNTWLEEAHPFAIRIYESALLCYDAGNLPLVVPAAPDPEKLKTLLEKEYRFYDRMASEFMVAADLYRLRGNHNLTLFNIHQAAEQTFLAIIRCITGLRANTHNMDKLFRYSRCFSGDLARLFPRDTQEEKHLFDTLQKAYVDTRYRKDYQAKASEVTTLFKRIERLQTIAETLIRQQLPVSQ